MQLSQPARRSWGDQRLLPARCWRASAPDQGRPARVSISCASWYISIRLTAVETRLLSAAAALIKVKVLSGHPRQLACTAEQCTQHCLRLPRMRLYSGAQVKIN